MIKRRNSKLKSHKRYRNPGRAVVCMLFSLFCLAGAAFSLWLFWTDLNQIFYKQNEKSVGEIVYKQNNVQRRFGSRLAWNLVPVGSPVYNGDLVRTANSSEAGITFISGDNIELSENTFVVIRYDEASGRAMIELIEGKINLNSLLGNTSVFTGGREVRPGPGSFIIEDGAPEGNTILPEFLSAALPDVHDNLLKLGDLTDEYPFTFSRRHVPDPAPAPAPIPAPRAALPAPALLPRATGLVPNPGTIIDGDYLNENEAIIFFWNPVPGADAYLFTLRQESIILRQVNENGLEFDPAEILNNGLCIWQVEAVALNPDGSIRRRGIIAESRFTIAVPVPLAPELDDPGILYDN